MAKDDELERIKRNMMRRLMRPEEGSIWIDGSVVELNSENFDEALAETSRPILVDFWADWCSPCKAMKPVMEALAREYTDQVSFAKIDVDRNLKIARRYTVMSIPNFVLFKNGRPVDRVIGAVGRPGLEAMLKRHLA